MLNQFNNLKIKNKLFAGNAITVLLVVVLGFITFKAVNSLLKSNHMVDHTHVVIGNATDILAAGVDMETGMRGYLLAGKEDFLAPYTNGYKTFQKKVTDLKTTVSDNSEQVKLLGEIEKNISQWKENVTEPTIALRRNIGNSKTMDDMADLVGEARGKKYFDKFRGQIALFIEREEKLLLQREQSAVQGGRSIDSLESAAKWVKHTQHVIKEAMRVEAAAVDMETGMRGYLLSGKEDFLDPYKNGSALFYSKVLELQETVSDNRVFPVRLCDAPYST